MYKIDNRIRLKFATILTRKMKLRNYLRKGTEPHVKLVCLKTQLTWYRTGSFSVLMDYKTTKAIVTPLGGWLPPVNVKKHRLPISIFRHRVFVIIQHHTNKSTEL
jgi:hypothetical protein